VNAIQPHMLVCLPIVMAVLLSFLAPDYMGTLTSDHVGRYILGGALGLQLVGILAIRRIISIKV
jgi:Flp pilus assembly protein TadB